MHKMRGFTLIELLIVVAIIAILAAIAVPNFLEAQVRSKVSRCKADMRTIKVALESYAVDANRYPPQWHGARVQYPEVLSSPMAYLPNTTNLTDPFAVQFYYDPYWRLYGYWHYKSYFDIFPHTDMEVYRKHPQVNSYLVTCWGPDQVYDYPNYYGPYGRGVANAMPLYYDPTNGTASKGDIIFYGP